MGIFVWIAALFWPPTQAHEPSLKEQLDLAEQLELAEQHDLAEQPDLTVRGGLDLSILGILPPELILCINQFLPLESAASFALTCRPIYFILGTRYWEALRRPDQLQHRMAFLTLLDRDMLEYIVCHPCKKLHLPIQGVDTRWMHQPWNIMRILRPCRLEYHRGRVIEYVHLLFEFTNFQAAMKRYRLGLPFMKYLSLLNDEYMGLAERLPYHSRTQVKVIAGSLFLRIQFIFIMSFGQIPKILQGPLIGICPHTATRHVNSHVLEGTRCRIKHNPYLNQCRKATGLKQCLRCPTEYQVDVQECEQRGSLVVLTKWLDIGEGRGWTDFKWRSHLANMEAYRTGTEDMSTHLRELGFIRNSFEENSQRYFDPFPSPESADEYWRVLGRCCRSCVCTCKRYRYLNIRN